MARAREEEGEFLWALPQDETMKERRAEVYFRRNPEMFKFFMLKEGLLSARFEAAGWLPLQCAACFSGSFLSFSHSIDLPLTVLEGGGLTPSERLSLECKVSRFL